MSSQVAGWLVSLAGLYLLVGLVFAAAFVAVGAGVVQPKARSAGWGFRLLILPGAAALWPLLALLWRGAAASAEEAR